MPAPRTALVGWELGGGRGHIEETLPIVAPLLARGWRIVAAMRHPATARDVFARLGSKAAGLTLVQAPILRRRAPPDPALRSIAEILDHMGYSHQGAVTAVVGAWSRLIDEARPTLVLANFAPSLVAAARGRARAIVLGTGWSIPPDVAPVPPLPVTDYPAERALAAEDRVRAAMDGAPTLARRIERLSQLLHGDESFVLCHPTLDPYRGRRGGVSHWPPYLPAPSPHEPRRRDGLVVYLPPGHPARGNLIEAVRILGVRAVAFFGGELPAAPANLRVSPEPLNLAALTPRAACFVHHGGLGVTTWGLVHGTPQVGLAGDLEKYLIAGAVVGARRGAALPQTASAAAIGAVITTASRLRLSPDLGGLSQSEADPQRTVDAILQACA